MHGGEEPGEEDVCDIFKDLPHGKGYEDKFVFGISSEMGDLIGVVDLIRDYPVNGVWTIGWLILDPSERIKGLGRKIDDYITTFALRYHADKLRIGVIQNNEKGYGFWRHLGYCEVSRVNWKSRNKDHVVILMKKDISNKSEA